jgi:hypothetical protein
MHNLSTTAPYPLVMGGVHGSPLTWSAGHQGYSGMNLSLGIVIQIYLLSFVYLIRLLAYVFYLFMDVPSAVNSGGGTFGIETVLILAGLAVYH